LINKPRLIFVYIGKKIPSYAYHSLNFAVENSGLKVVLISDAEPKSKLNKAIEHVRYVSNEEKLEDLSSSQFRDGFWIKTTERFYAIQQFVTRTGIEHFFHAELDNLIFNISNVSYHLDIVGSGIFVPRMNDKFALASLMYVNSKEAFDGFCEFSRSFHYSQNDMEILSQFLDEKPSMGFSLLSNPEKSTNILESHESEALQSAGLFDAAAIGQWYFGIDPRNSYGPVRNLFQNDRHAGNLRDYRLNRNLQNCQITISSKSESFVKLEVNNLHVHSKILKRLVIGSGLDQIIERTNESHPTLISLNLWGKFRWARDVLVAVRKKLVWNPRAREAIN
jgi:hypothetical protein